MCTLTEVDDPYITYSPGILLWDGCYLVVTGAVETVEWNFLKGISMKFFLT
jgi:hypothetical protein